MRHPVAGTPARAAWRLAWRGMANAAMKRMWSRPSPRCLPASQYPINPLINRPGSIAKKPATIAPIIVPP